MRSTRGRLRRTSFLVSRLSFCRIACAERGGRCLAAKNRSGIITLDDLKNYKTITRTPVNITYRGNRIFSTVAPSSGTVVLSALKIFEGYPATAKTNDPEYDLEAHRLIQATRFGYGQRTNFGDPAYTANVSALEKLVESGVESFRLVLTFIHLIANSSRTLRSSRFEPE